MHLVGFIVRNLTRRTVTWTSKMKVKLKRVDNIHVAQDKDQGRAFVNMVTNFRGP